ncbi:hypothetical protein J5500_03265 [Candidatus Saccharibacteria bacterium]|nr:hypothetical protein [Candidatus Saccharibacteria bacterium]
MNTVLSKLFSMLPSFNSTALGSKPFAMRVLVTGHAYRCGFGISEDEEYVTTLQPLDSDMLERYGESIEIYSKAFNDCLEVGKEFKLPFVPNPDYNPEILGSQPLLLFVSHPQNK